MTASLVEEEDMVGLDEQSSVRYGRGGWEECGHQSVRGGKSEQGENGVDVFYRQKESDTKRIKTELDVIETLQPELAIWLAAMLLDSTIDMRYMRRRGQTLTDAMFQCSLGSTIVWHAIRKTSGIATPTGHHGKHVVASFSCRTG